MSARREQGMAIILLTYAGRKVGKRLKHDTVLGRSVECDVTCDIHGVSRSHACIRRHHGHYIVEDLGSSNGTFVNGFRITQPQVLLPGDEIEIGLARFVFLDQLDIPDEAVRWPRKGVRIRSVRFHCPNCSAHLKAPTDRAGKRVRCTSCHTTLIVPRHEDGHVRILEEAQTV